MASDADAAVDVAVGATEAVHVQGMPSLRTATQGSAVGLVGTSGPASTAAGSVLDSWSEFALEERRVKLDRQSLEVADRQEASTRSRKLLAEATRTLKKNVAPEAAKSFGVLLKDYQTEIDSLTNRAKSSEACFLSLYKALYEVPDPTPALRQAEIDHARVLELEARLRAAETERDRYKMELKEAAGNENLIESLETALQVANEQIEARIKNAVDAKQQHWLEAHAKTVDAYEMREQELLHQLNMSNENRRSLQKAVEATQHQLLEYQGQLEKIKSSRAIESEMVVEDLERARTEVAELRRRCGDLESRPRSNVVADGNPSLQELATELATREVQISQLSEQILALEKTLSGKDERKSDEVAKLSSIIREKDSRIEQLSDVLKSMPSHEEYSRMKREFEAMESVQLDFSETGEGQGSEDTLEKRLISRVKQLESRLTNMRVALTEKESSLQESEGKALRVEGILMEKIELVARLEDTISRMTSNPRGADIENSKDDHDWSSWGAEGAEDSSSRTGVGPSADREPSMMDIVAGQRDRFRTRSMELEEDNRKLIARIELQISEVENIKADNMRLYEKIRFLESYASGSVGTSRDPPADEEGILSRYQALYEDMLNPYTLFNRRERQRKLTEMSVPER